MKLPLFARLAGIALVTLGLAGCMDMSVDVEVLSETTAKGTMTQTMSADVYPMIKANKPAEGEESAEADFCADGTLTENADGSATCVMVEEGKFADLNFDSEPGQESVRFSSAGPGLVRVAFNTADMEGDLSSSGGEEMDAETKTMMEAYFQGHFITLRVSGGTITDTNMTKAENGLSAETKISFVDLLNGKADLPDELYAIVKK